MNSVTEQANTIFAEITQALKYGSLVLFLLFFFGSVQSQTDSSAKDSTVVPVKKPVVKTVVDTAAQSNDSTISPVDSLQLAYADSLRKDSLQKITLAQQRPTITNDTSTYAAIMHHPYIPLHNKKVFRVIQYKQNVADPYIFYSLLFIVAIIAFIRVSFPKYFQSLFQLFLQTSFRQKQTKEQLLQDSLASLLSNILFVISVGMFIALLANRYNWVNENFWWLFAYSCAILAIVYLVKYVFLKFSGWVFNENNAANTYIFIVFLVNKVLGVCIVPFSFILAFSVSKIVTVASTISIIFITLLLIYRYVASLGTIRSSLKVNALHFFLYLCAVEVLPFVLMYKAFFNFIND